MPFTTREELIAAGKWPVVPVEVPGVGPVRLARAAGSTSLRVAAIRAAGGVDVQALVFAEMLRGSAINSENRPLFSSLDEARNALDGLSDGAILALIRSIPPDESDATPGNSTASQGAGSPSGSA